MQRLIALRTDAMHLLRSDFDKSRPAAFQSIHLIAEASTHFDFDLVEKGASAPIILVRGERQLFSGLPVSDMKWTRPDDAAAGISLRNRISRQREFLQEFRSRNSRLDGDKIPGGRDVPSRVPPAQGSGGGLDSERAAILKLDVLAQTDLHALIRG